MRFLFSMNETNEMYRGFVLPRVFAEMRGGVDGYEIRRLNNETPRYAGTCAKNEGGHGSRGGKTSRDSDSSSECAPRDRNFVQSCEIARFHCGTII